MDRVLHFPQTYHIQCKRVTLNCRTVEGKGQQTVCQCWPQLPAHANAITEADSGAQVLGKAAIAEGGEATCVGSYELLPCCMTSVSVHRHAMEKGSGDVITCQESRPSLSPPLTDQSDKYQQICDIMGQCPRCNHPSNM